MRKTTGYERRWNQSRHTQADLVHAFSFRRRMTLLNGNYNLIAGYAGETRLYCDLPYWSGLWNVRVSASLR